MEAIVHRNLCREKSVKKVEKSSFIQKIDIRLRRSEDCSTTTFAFFVLLTKAFRLFDLLGLFYFMRYLNRAV